jgi:mannose-6-phosphate isomerase-like protein (cupin superfamily)
VLNGNGIIRIGNEKFNIEAKNYYNIKPKDNVYIENNGNEILEIIYLSA